MATIQTRPVIADTGSEEVAQLRRSYSQLLDVLGDLITGLKSAADVPAINALATTAETALQDNVVKVGSEPNAPAAPVRPAI